MILGEFEFDTLYQESSDEDSLTLIFTMTLLIGLIVFGSLIMINLIIAIIVSDIQSLAKAAKQQVLINKVLPCDDFQFLISHFTFFQGESCSSSEQSTGGNSENNTSSYWEGNKTQVSSASYIFLIYLAFHMIVSRPPNPSEFLDVICLHSTCNCGGPNINSKTREELKQIVKRKYFYS